VAPQAIPFRVFSPERKGRRHRAHQIRPHPSPEDTTEKQDSATTTLTSWVKTLKQIIVGLLIHAYAQAGRRADAIHLLEKLRRRKLTGYIPAAALILAYLGLGEYDQAFLWLEEAYKEQSNILQFLKVHPFFDPLRDDSRFKDLLRRIGLPE